MLLISHRGNLNGSEPDYENKPEKIVYAIEHKIPVEIDLRYRNKKFYLGHDEPQYEIDAEFLMNHRDWLWVHCKEKDAFQEALKLRKIHCFWHDNDDYTMTNFGYVWAYPGKEPVGSLCIGVMPEKCWSFEESMNKKFTGICTDFSSKFSELLNTQ